jgi:site-specific DNA recombinase
MVRPRRADSCTVSPESEVRVKSGAGSPSRSKRTSRRAVGVSRVSRVGGREGEAFVSPREQVQRIGDACARDGLELLKTLEERDVSGGAPLSKRHGLREAVEMVEAGEAEVVVVAYFDRLVRSLTVQAEVVERIERAGGAILAVDVGEVRADTAGRWLSSTMLGMVAEYHRRVTAERTADAKRRAVERGVPPFDRIPPGYRRRADRTVEKDPKVAKVVAEGFRMRAAGATIVEVRAYLRKNGVERSFHGVQAMLGSRFYIGELAFGELVNRHAHEGIVDEVTFQRVQRMKVSRGRRAKSDRLLARLGVLRCATCDARMIVGTQTQNGRRYPFYRCPTIGDCTARSTISAELVERHVLDAARQIAEGEQGTASLEAGLDDARLALERAESALDAAVQAFSGLDDVASARDRLNGLRDARDAAADRVAELENLARPAVVVSADDQGLRHATERALIRAAIDRVTVAPGRGDSRITVYAR